MAYPRIRSPLQFRLLYFGEPEVIHGSSHDQADQDPLHFGTSRQAETRAKCVLSS